SILVRKGSQVALEDYQPRAFLSWQYSKCVVFIRPGTLQNDVWTAVDGLSPHSSPRSVSESEIERLNRRIAGRGNFTAGSGNDRGVCRGTDHRIFSRRGR